RPTLTCRFPKLRAVHEMVRLLPELVLGEFAVKPAIGYAAVPGWWQAGQVGALRGARDGGKHWANPNQPSRLRSRGQPRGVRPDQSRREANDVQNCDAFSRTHEGKTVRRLNHEYALTEQSSESTDKPDCFAK